MTDTDWILATEHDGGTRHFAAEALPVTIGGAGGTDLNVVGVSGAVEFDRLDGVFVVQPARETRGAYVNGERITGARPIASGDVISLDHARIRCTVDAGRLHLAVELQQPAGDTAPPAWDTLARDTRPLEELEIQPIAFRPGTGQAGRGRRRLRPATVAVAAAFAVLAVLAWFAFTARSVELRFEPRAEQADVVGTMFKLNVGDRFLLRSGRHRVVAELAGHYPIDTTIDVGRSPDQTIRLQFTRLPDLVSIATEPATEAEVFLDGELLGRAPLTDVEVPPGEYSIALRAPRFLPADLDLAIEGGGARRSVLAPLTPNWAPVTLETDPPGAEVRVDGELAGVTPLAMELEAGERELEARLRGYNAWRGRVMVEPDTPQSLTPVRLVQADGRVELVSQPGDAAVSVNGEYRGRTPLELRLAPGREYRITLSRPGHETVVRELSVAADSGRRVEVELPVQLGEVEVVSTPPSAEIWVDGQRLGTTPGTLELMAVQHEIEVRQSGFAAKTMPVTPRPGFPQRLQFELESLDAASGGGYPQVIRTSLGQELRLIPAGEFTMGSSRAEPRRRSNEVLRPVSLSRAFYLGTHEVTNAEFRAWRETHSSGSFGEHSLDGDDQPVVRVSWEEAVEYLNWLSVRDRLQPVYENTQAGWAARRPLRNGYRLPTEAEWEWAARAAGRDEPLTFPWGNALPPPDRAGNFADVSASRVLPTTLVTYSDGYPVAAPVGSFGANTVGIFDLGGNVAEWVQDYYGIETGNTAALATDPLGPETGRFRVVRGPSWRSATIENLRLAYRDYSADGREDIGFRIARNLE
jgi:formylglycine-generating enzyme required for sulfatase activity